MSSLSPASAVFLVIAAVVPAQDVGVSFTNGVNDFLETPYAPELVSRAGITVEAWITYDDNIGTGTSHYPTIVRQNQGNGQESYFLRVNAGTTGARTLRWKVVTAAGAQLFANWNFTAGQLLPWTHVAATYDGVTASLFVDGVLVASGAGGNNQPIRDLGGTLRVGKGDDANGAAEVWNGGLDEVRIWPVARTAAEILASRQQKLLGVPGRVVTWNLDGFLFDTSAGLVLTANGNPAPFTSNPLAFAVPAPLLPAGVSTPGCLGDLRLLPTCTPQVGNAAFAVACTRLPVGSIAIWGITLGTLPSPLPLLGVGVWLDPAVLVTTTALASPLGALRQAFPIPPAASPGFVVALQAIAVDPCGPAGFTASDALQVVLQP